MIGIVDHEQGCLLPIRVQPGAKHAGIFGIHGSALKVSVKSPALEGRANDAVLELLRELLGLRRSALELVSGGTARDKKLLVRGVTKEALLAQLEKLLSREP